MGEILTKHYIFVINHKRQIVRGDATQQLQFLEFHRNHHGFALSILNPHAVSTRVARLLASLHSPSYRLSSAACVCSAVGDSEAGSCAALKSAEGICYHSAENSA